MHWPVEPAQLRLLLPASLELDLFEGRAYVAVVPFRMTGIRARFCPPLPGLAAFPELNLRTYVRPINNSDRPGVFFWSLEATNPIAVATARALFHLPYMNAEMSCEERGGEIHYRSRRTRRHEPPARFSGSYRPLRQTVKSALTDFLTERYCLYSADAQGRLYVGEIHHEPWPLYDAAAVIEENSIASAAGITLPEETPMLHFAKFQDVAIWPLRRAV